MRGAAGWYAGRKLRPSVLTHSLPPRAERGARAAADRSAELRRRVHRPAGAVKLQQERCEPWSQGPGAQPAHRRVTIDSQPWRNTMTRQDAEQSWPSCRMTSSARAGACIVLTSAGHRAFSASTDMTATSPRRRERPRSSATHCRRTARTQSRSSPPSTATAWAAASGSFPRRHPRQQLPRPLRLPKVVVQSCRSAERPSTGPAGIG